MKKLLYGMIISGVTLMISLSSCSDYLNFEYIFKDEVNLDSVFEKKIYTEQWLADVYEVLQRGQNVMVASKKNHPFNFLGDDMYYADYPGGSSYASYKNGRYDEGTQQDNWYDNYIGIRKASIFIHNVDRNLEMTPREILDNKGQARFVRAYCYWILLRKYGPIPIIPDEGLDYRLDYDDLALPRNTYEECAEFIASEMALAAQEMEHTRSNREIARATAGAALAIRARAYLYAASPLFNGNDDLWARQLVDDTGKRLISPERNEELWAKAAAAAKDLMDLGDYRLYTARFREEDGGEGFSKTIAPPYHKDFSDKNFPEGWRDIDPLESYRSVFNGALSVTDNPELIFSRVQNAGSENIYVMLLHQVPRSLNGWGCHGATLKQANAYYMHDGSDHYAYKKADPTIGRPDSLQGYTTSDNDIPFLRADVAKEFAYREPRFYASIAFNGSYWECSDAPSSFTQNRQVFYYRGTQDGQLDTDNDHVVLTGLGVKKFYHPRDYFSTPPTGDRPVFFYGRYKSDIDIRYAEILLIYAEALNELNGTYNIPDYTGEKTITVSRDVNEIRKGIKPVRMRAGIPDLPEEIYASTDLFRKALKRERQIELFAETHRYFDLRRWKTDVTEEEDIPVWGYNMIMTKAQRDLWHTPVKIPALPNLFIEKQYLWPISHDELRRNKRMTQNPGWTYYN